MSNVSVWVFVLLLLLLFYVSRYLVLDGMVWFMKGRNWWFEVDDVWKDWSFDFCMYKS